MTDCRGACRTSDSLPRRLCSMATRSHVEEISDSCHGQEFSLEIYGAPCSPRNTRTSIRSSCFHQIFRGVFATLPQTSPMNFPLKVKNQRRIPPGGSGQIWWQDDEEGQAQKRKHGYVGVCSAMLLPLGRYNLTLVLEGKCVVSCVLL